MELEVEILKGAGELLDLLGIFLVLLLDVPLVYEKLGL